jgi:hypothetical protein
VLRQPILRHYCGGEPCHASRIVRAGTSSTNCRVAGVVNAIFVFVTFLLSLPALFLPTSRGWLRTQGWLVVVCATFTLGLGLAIWIETLETRHNLSLLWGSEPPLIQSLLQQKVSRLCKR